MCTSWPIVVNRLEKQSQENAQASLNVKKISFSNSWLCFITLGHESRREKSVTELNKEQSKRRLSRKQLAQDFTLSGLRLVVKSSRSLPGSLLLYTMRSFHGYRLHREIYSVALLFFFCEK